MKSKVRDLNAALIDALDKQDDGERLERLRHRMREWENRADRLRMHRELSKESWELRYNL